MVGSGDGKVIEGWRNATLFFVHERGVLCAELGLGEKFVHEKVLWCAKLLLAVRFVHERGVLSAKMGGKDGAE